MNRFVSNRYDENSFHTIGVEFMNKDLEVDGEKYTLQIWDTAGQERFRALRTPFYRGSDICLLCFALNDHISFRALGQWKDEFIKYADIKNNQFPFIAVGNKADIAPSQRDTTSDQINEWCEDNKITNYIETSSKTATNVTEAFSMAVKQWKKLEKQTERELRDQGDTIDLTKGVTIPQNRLCCSTSFGDSRSNSPAITARGGNQAYAD
ncbi:RAB9B family protein [Megaselia abdita]